MKNIDFSCKHDILIENEDGSLLPMDEPYFASEKIAPGTWKILSDGDYFYLVEGDNEALVIDSGYGCGNVREYLQSLTVKPVKNIANTHDHFDHTANNAYFDCAFMSAETEPLRTIPFKSFEGIEFPRDYKVQVIDEGYEFHLGNRDLVTFKIPDHAVGSLAFLDRKERILFSGDEIGMPMGKKLNGSVEIFANYMEKLSLYRHEFDVICAGFGVLDASIVDRYLKNVRHILAGNEGMQYEKPVFPRTPLSASRTIYKRRLPHPCDLPKEFYEEADRNLRVMEYADCRIIYDIRKIHD
jgi:glyoxylase-like metal-dependent hydrolase (beta-lactamase superfamily II)